MSDNNSMKTGQKIENVVHKRSPNGQQANERVLYFISHKESDNETTILIKSLLHTYENG